MSFQKSAVLSACGKFRYRLGRRWGDGRPLAFVMLNPSTADADLDDPTIRRCIGFARSHDFDAIDVVNLFAYRATKPADLKAAGYPVGDENDDHIARAASSAGAVCCAWGSNARMLVRQSEVIVMLRALCRPMALGLDSHGVPRHPLMLPNSARLTEWTP